MTKSTITINGHVYDAITGQAVDGSGKVLRQRASQNKQVTPDIVPVKARGQIKPAPRPKHEIHAPAQAMHSSLQKSKTLQRQALQKPSPDSKRSPMISRFAKKPVTEKTITEVSEVKNENIDQPAPIHPTVAKIMNQKTAKIAEASKPKLSGSELKEKLIKERLEEVKEAPHKKERPNWVARQPRLVTILSSTLALLLLGGYLTYITLPSISLKMAATRAGVDATLPDYKPEGYSLDGPIAYNSGEVVISYKSETNNSAYELTQKSTNWDSEALLDNYVTEQTNSYLTYQEKGVTVYTFNNEAVWVNGGLLYTISGDAKLSADQIMNLATSI